MKSLMLIFALISLISQANAAHNELVFEGQAAKALYGCLNLLPKESANGNLVKTLPGIDGFKCVATGKPGISWEKDYKATCNITLEGARIQVLGTKLYFWDEVDSRHVGGVLNEVYNRCNVSEREAIQMERGAVVKAGVLKIVSKALVLFRTDDIVQLQLDTYLNIL